MERILIKNFHSNKAPVRCNHPDLKGSFSCLGEWYNLNNEQSMKFCQEALNSASPFNKTIGLSEIESAKEAEKVWQPEEHLDFLYNSEIGEHRH